MIGITVPGGYYSPFIDQHLNYIAGLRWLLLNASKGLLNLFGYATYFKDSYTIKMQLGRGVKVVYSCLGYGLFSFWIAFIFANNPAVKKMLLWMVGGVLIIFLLNVCRIAIMLIAVNKHWPSLFNLDNHTLFNIAAYAVIFIMIYFFDRAGKKQAML